MHRVSRVGLVLTAVLAVHGAASTQSHSRAKGRSARIYNNTPLRTDWLAIAPANSNGRGLRRYRNVKPGTSIKLDTPITDRAKSKAAFAIWGTVSPAGGAKNVETWLNYLHAMEIPAKHRRTTNWTSQLRWYHEAEEGQSELALPLHRSDRDLIDGESGDVYLRRYNNPHAAAHVEITHPLCRWINAGESVRERSKRAKVFARVIDETARGVNIRKKGAELAGMAGKRISPYLLGLICENHNYDWHGIKVERVTNQYSIWGDRLPWAAGDTILELDGTPTFNVPQLAYLLTRHVLDRGIEVPCKVVVKKRNGSLQQYRVSYRYNPLVFKKLISPAQAKAFIIAEDSLWGPIARLFKQQRHYTGRNKTQAEKRRAAKEGRMTVYQLYPDEVKDGELLSWIVPSPLRILSAIGKASKIGKAAGSASRTRSMIRNLAVTSVETIIATYQEPVPLGSRGVREEAAARGIAQSLVFEKILNGLTRRR